MRILGHELNAIYCGKWQVLQGLGTGAAGTGLPNLGQAAAVVVAAFEKCNGATVAMAASQGAASGVFK